MDEWIGERVGVFSKPLNIVRGIVPIPPGSLAWNLGRKRLSMISRQPHVAFAAIVRTTCSHDRAGVKPWSFEISLSLLNATPTRFCLLHPVVLEFSRFFSLLSHFLSLFNNIGLNIRYSK